MLTALLFATLMTTQVNAQISAPCSYAERWKGMSHDLGDGFVNDVLSRPAVPGAAIVWSRLKLPNELKDELTLQYLFARQMFLAGYPGVALSGFNSLLQENAAVLGPDLTRASLECAELAIESDPKLAYMGLRIGRFVKPSNVRGSSRVMTRLILRETIQGNTTIAITDPWVKGFSALRKKRFNAAADAFLKLGGRGFPKELKFIEPEARIQVARAIAHAGKWSQASEHFRRVPRDANLWVDALQELAWAQLNADRADQAIGTTLQLQKGAFRRVFTPESLMVLSMSLNELCHYPEASRAIEEYRGQYKEAYSWLQLNQSRVDFAFVRRLLNQQVDGIPVRVKTELIKNPYFQASVESENRQKILPAELLRLRTRRINEAREGAVMLVKEIQETVKELDQEVSKRKPASPLSQEFIEHVKKIRHEVKVYRMLRRFLPNLLPIEKKATQIAASALKRIQRRADTEVKRSVERMVITLDEVASNMELVEIEIFQGAGRDIVWRNAHPDLAKNVDDRKKDNTGAKWDWGRSRGLISEDREVWEDEVGFMEVDMSNHCDRIERGGKSS
jgi:hypothetical protein